MAGEHAVFNAGSWGIWAETQCLGTWGAWRPAIAQPGMPCPSMRAHLNLHAPPLPIWHQSLTYPAPINPPCLAGRVGAPVLRAGAAARQPRRRRWPAAQHPQPAAVEPGGHGRALAVMASAVLAVQALIHPHQWQQRCMAAALPSSAPLTSSSATSTFCYMHWAHWPH